MLFHAFFFPLLHTLMPYCFNSSFTVCHWLATSSKLGKDSEMCKTPELFKGTVSIKAFFLVSLGFALASFQMGKSHGLHPVSITNLLQSGWQVTTTKESSERKNKCATPRVITTVLRTTGTCVGYSHILSTFMKDASQSDFLLLQEEMASTMHKPIQRKGYKNQRQIKEGWETVYIIHVLP